MWIAVIQGIVESRQRVGPAHSRLPLLSFRFDLFIIFTEFILGTCAISMAVMLILWIARNISCVSSAILRSWVAISGFIVGSWRSVSRFDC